MLIVSPAHNAVAAFFLLLFFAVIACGVCVAFGAGANPLLAPGASSASAEPSPALHQARDDAASSGQDPSAEALQRAGSAVRARVGT